MAAALSLIIRSNKLHFQATDIDHFLNSLLLALQTHTTKDSKDNQQVVAYVLAPAFDLVKDCVEEMTDGQR